jgi:hypothetical protein
MNGHHHSNNQDCDEDDCDDEESDGWHWNGFSNNDKHDQYGKYGKHDKSDDDDCDDEEEDAVEEEEEVVEEEETEPTVAISNSQPFYGTPILLPVLQRPQAAVQPQAVAGRQADTVTPPRTGDAGLPYGRFNESPVDAQLAIQTETTSTVGIIAGLLAGLLAAGAILRTSALRRA